jgi:hypothetical protein
MNIENVVHRGLRRFERDDPSGLPAAYIEKFRNIRSFVQDTRGGGMSRLAAARPSHPGTIHQDGHAHGHMDMQTSFKIADARKKEGETNVEQYVPKATPPEPHPKPV